MLSGELGFARLMCHPMHPLVLGPLWPHSPHPSGVISPNNGRKMKWKVPKVGKG